MEEYPRTLAQLERQFATETACAQYLYRLRWPDGFVCPRCAGPKGWFTSRGLYKCAECKSQVSVKAGTVFERSRLPLSIWFRMIWWVTSQKNGASAKGLQRILGLGSYETAWTWLHKLRRAMVRPGRDRLVGTIEVDETYIGGQKPGKRGRGAEGKALVLIAAQVDGKRIGRIRLRRVMDASAASIQPAVQEAVTAGSLVRTDGWTGYSSLGRLGYVHEIVRKKVDIGDNLLPRCNTVASLLKRWLVGTHHGAVSHEHLDYYLDEYTFRFNRRTSRYRGKLFYRLIQQAVAVEPVPYSALVKHVRRPKPKTQHVGVSRVKGIPRICNLFC
jgi:transposase-like protein